MAGVWLGGGVLWAQAIPATEDLLPATTAGFLAAPDTEHLEQQWGKTQLGKLMADKKMEPFAKDLKRQLDDRWSGVQKRLGLTLDDLKTVPGGEVGLGLILPAPKKAVFALVVDVTGKLDEADAMLKKISTNLLHQGAKRDTLKVPESAVPVIQFDVPPPKDQQLAPRRKGTEAPAAKPKKTKSQQVFYCLTGNLLVACDDLGETRGILARLSGKRADSLAGVPGLKKVMQRCRKDNGGADPQIRWFIQPVSLVAAIRAATPEEKRRKRNTLLDLLREQGFTAVLGIGGFVDLAAEGFELVHRSFVLAPPPYEKSMKMLVFPNAQDFAPQPWVPREIATYATFYVDILNAFDNFGPLFDHLFGQGETGIWGEVLESLKKDPNGPQIDVREELIKNLGQRVTMITDYQLPITPTSERLLFAIQTTNGKNVAIAITKSMENDPTAKRREIDGHVIWEIVEEEAPKVPNISVGAIPSLDLDQDPADDEEEEEEDEQRLLPHAAVTVAHGHLFISSHIDFLLKILKPRPARETLGRNLGYVQVDATVVKLKIAAKCARTFSLTDEAYRATYELIRQGKMPQSETLLGRVLNSLFGAGKKGVVRAQKIDGAKLPDYGVVRRSLGPAGMTVTSEDEGWFFKGFLLTK